MKLHYNLKRALKLLSLALALVFCLLVLQDFVLCHADQNRERIKGYYLEDAGSLDVVLVGASEVYVDFASALAYERFGFTSYPYATQSSTILNYLAAVKEVVRTQRPKLIVIEINGALYNDDKIFDKEANLRNLGDNMPLNSNKTELIRKVATSDEIEHYVPIIKYHSVWRDDPKSQRWPQAIIADRLRGYTYLKGARTKTKAFHKEGKIYNYTLADEQEKLPLHPRAQAALTELLDYCRSEQLNVIFVRFPHIVGKGGLIRYKRSLTAADLIRSYGFDYIGLDEKYDEIGLDFDSDFYNQEHMNIRGQVKLTEYFGGYLAEHYGIGPSSLSDSQRAEWDESARYYEAFRELASAELKKGSKSRDMGGDLETQEKMQKYLK